MEAHPGEEALKEKFPHNRKASHSGDCVEGWKPRGQRRREKRARARTDTHTHTRARTHTEYAPRCNCQCRSRPGVSATSSRGLDRQAWAAQSVLRVRTWPECPEDTLRQLATQTVGSSERERKKRRELSRRRL